MFGVLVMQMKYGGWPLTKLLNRAKVSKCA